MPAEVWHPNAPIYDRVRAGETVVLADALFPIARDGVLEDAWFTLGCSPLWDVPGGAAGARWSGCSAPFRRAVDRLWRPTPAPPHANASA